jgi:hypothetical protein
MKVIAVILASALLWQGGAFSADRSSGLELYREKMAYWISRGESAFECKNRFELALFLYDSTFEEGVGPSEELADFIEVHTLRHMDCVRSSLLVLPQEKIETVIEHYYREPLLRDQELFKGLIQSLRANPSVKMDAALTRVATYLKR